ncbi:MAG: leucyl aminopeptidase [Proteobacteria bacterium]|jgi:leucyl aminopeptidase|nr:leucyl aminopeptidase [Pseudomonadota bacterium]MBT6348954.1 leucyl aminopeptidase [Pseudomonadota bacterium]
MKIQLSSLDVLHARTDCLVVAVREGAQQPPSTRKIERASKGLIKSLMASGDIDGRPGNVLLVPFPSGIQAKRLLLVGVGDKPDIDDLASAALAAARQLCSTQSVSAVVTLTEIAVTGTDATTRARVISQAIQEASYRFNQLKTSKGKEAARRQCTVNRVSLLASSGKNDTAMRTGIQEACAIANGVALAKDLSNLPGNLCTPSYLANQARKLGKSHKLKVNVLDEAKMKALGMGALLSVSRGSREPARLIVMEHQGGQRSDKPVVLVGKGLTFDAGGISLKPAAAMDEMKYDMCGGASVFGAMVAASELKLKLNVIGIVPSSENLPDGAANKPGDIVTSMSGKTIEILNTDAEGRLILCDALTYAERYKPAAIIDIATLTGACVVALGHPATGLFSPDDKLAEELLACGESARDRAWRMPIWDEYQKQLNSPFADIANIGGRTAGAVTAACFLSRFTKNMAWAHLDIAGTAWHSGANKGATGRPVSMLTRFLINRTRR